MRVAAFYPNFFHVTGIAYAALSIIENMQSEQLNVSLMGITSGKTLKKPFYSNAISPYTSSLVYRFFSVEHVKKIAEFRYLHSLENAEPAYLWPGINLSLHQKIHDGGHPIIIESVNTHQATSKAILDKEYQRLGLPITHGIIDEETAKLNYADHVFSCSPCVKASLIENGFPAEKILDTSYGLKQDDILSLAEIDARKKHAEVTVIFVGTIGVRKGPHLLLDYWCRAQVKGKLKLVGHIQPEVKHLITPYLERADIEHVPFIDDLSQIYKEADLFVLPSLEEGSPLVTYMALGAGLPSIVSPMGGGGVVEHEVSGLIIDPHDDAGWIAALQRLMQDQALREKFSAAAYQMAPRYLWSEVGTKRAQLLLSAFERRN